MCMRMKADEFSIMQLEQLHHQILTFKSLSKPDQKQLKNVARKLRHYCQMIVWGDKFNNDFVDYFCEVKSLETMIEIFAAMKEQSILIAVIEGISMLLINLSREESIHYFLSNSSLMKFQMMKFSSLDTELAEYYINFLKSISIRLNPMTIKLFYNQKYSNFPLIWQASKFYNHPQTLIRNTSKNIILSVAKIDDQKVQTYFGSFPFIIYYSHLAYFTFDTCLKIDKNFNFQQIPLMKLNQHYQQLFDLIIYWEDLMSTVKQPIRQKIINSYIQGVIVYLNFAIFSDFRTFFSPKMAIYFFSILMREGAQPKLMNFIVLMLMGRYLKKDFIAKLQQIQAIHRLKSHSKKWSFHNFWDDFVPQLTQYSRKVFNQQINTLDLSLAQSINPLAQTVYFKSPPETPRSNFSNFFQKNLAQSDMFSQYSTKDTQRQFEESQPQTPFEKQVSKLERIHSAQIEPNGNYQPSLSILDISQIFEQDLKQTLIDLEGMEDNHTKRTILGFLNSGDEHLILLTVEFLINMIKNKSISKQVLGFSGLDLEKTVDFYNLQTVGKILNSCFQIFKMGGYVFSLSTYKKIVSLIQILCEKQHIFSIHRQALDNIVKELIKNVCIYLTCQSSTIQKVQTFEAGQRESRKSILGLSFIQLITPSTKSSEDQIQISIYHLLRNLRSRLIHQPIKLSKIVSIKSNYPLGEQIKIPANLSLCQLMDAHSQKSKKCFVLIEDLHLILIQKSTSKVIFNLDVIRIACSRDTAIPKRNSLKVRQKDTKCITLKMSYDSEKLAEKEFLQFQKQKTRRGEHILNGITNELIEYQLGFQNISQ